MMARAGQPDRHRESGFTVAAGVTVEGEWASVRATDHEGGPTVEETNQKQSG